MKLRQELDPVQSQTASMTYLLNDMPESAVWNVVHAATNAISCLRPKCSSTSTELSPCSHKDDLIVQASLLGGIEHYSDVYLGSLYISRPENHIIHGGTRNFFSIGYARHDRAMKSAVDHYSRCSRDRTVC